MVAPINMAGRNLIRRITSKDMGVLRYDVLMDKEATQAVKE